MRPGLVSLRQHLEAAAVLQISGRNPMPGLRAGTADPLASLKILDLALMLLGGGAAIEGSEIAPLAGLLVDLARIEPVFSRLELADHRCLHLHEVSGAGFGPASCLM